MAQSKKGGVDATVARIMANQKKLAERMKTETLYMYNDDDNVYVKFVPGKPPIHKVHGIAGEFLMDKFSDIDANATHEITKELYDKCPANPLVKTRKS